jgi:hypothetical protein
MLSADRLRTCFERYFHGDAEWAAGMAFEPMARVSEAFPTPPIAPLRVLCRARVVFREWKRRCHGMLRPSARLSGRQEQIARSVDTVRWPCNEDAGHQAIQDLLGLGDEGISALFHLLASPSGMYIAWALGNGDAELVPYLLNVWTGPEHGFARMALDRTGEAGMARLVEEMQGPRSKQAAAAAAELAGDKAYDLATMSRQLHGAARDRKPIPMPDAPSEYRYLRGLRCPRCSGPFLARGRTSTHGEQGILDGWNLVCNVCRRKRQIVFRVPAACERFPGVFGVGSDVSVNIQE